MHEIRGLDGLCQMPFRPGDRRIDPTDLRPFVDHDKAVEFAGSAVRPEGDTLWCLYAGGMHRVAGF